MTSLPYNIRPNLAGDYPKIDPTALIDPSAQIIGHVEITRDVFVGPLTVIRADQRGPDGKVAAIVIGEEVNIQDGVIIHSDECTSVIIGPKTSIAHGVIIHGPCTIGKECFLATRSVVYKTTIEDHVWLGMGAIAMQVTIPCFTKVPVGSIIRDAPDAMNLRLMTDTERQYMEMVWNANSRLRMDYLELREKAEAIRLSSQEKADNKNLP